MTVGEIGALWASIQYQKGKRTAFLCSGYALFSLFDVSVGLNSISRVAKGKRSPGPGAKNRVELLVSELQSLLEESLSLPDLLALGLVFQTNYVESWKVHSEQEKDTKGYELLRIKQGIDRIQR